MIKAGNNFLESDHSDRSLKVAGNHKPVHEYSVMLWYVIFQGEQRIAECLEKKNPSLPGVPCQVTGIVTLRKE